MKRRNFTHQMLASEHATAPASRLGDAHAVVTAGARPPDNGGSTAPDPRSAISPTESIPGLAVRGYRSRGLQQVDLFWTGSRAGAFDVYRDGRRIATVKASGYTDRLGRNGSGSYSYHVRVTGTPARSNEAVVTFAAGRRGPRSDATTARMSSSAAPSDATTCTAEIDNRAIGEKLELDVDCLVVAVMSGVVTRHTDEHASV